MSPTDPAISQNADHMFSIFFQNPQKPKQKFCKNPNCHQPDTAKTTIKKQNITGVQKKSKITNKSPMISTFNPFPEYIHW